jgi:hypothetical protein
MTCLYAENLLLFAPGLYSLFDVSVKNIMHFRASFCT